jgi:PPM family protein phosphatase
VTLRLHYALRSHVGHVREGNEDSAYAGTRLLAVADGMGGHAAGEVASSTVIGLLAQLDEDVPEGDLQGALAAAVREANATLRDMTARDNALDGMGTTVTALLSSGSWLGVLHVGDSRAYLLRGDTMAQVTHDHTLVQDLVDQGRITPEQANSHPQRSLLMRALDGREVEPDVSVREAVPGDRYLLCTDGLSSVVSDETIEDALLLPTPREAVDRLVDLALKGGGPDNITVVVADILDDDGTDAGHTEPPMVAGAAAEKDVVPGAVAASDGDDPSGPSANAARIRRAGASAGGMTMTGFTGRDSLRGSGDFTGADDVTGVMRAAEPGDARAGGRRRKRTGHRRLVIAGVVVVVLVAGGFAGWGYLRSQYYIGVDSGRVALFQGVDANLAGLSLSKVRAHYMPIGQLEEPDRSSVNATIEVKNRAAANTIIHGLQTQTAAAVTPTPSPTPSLTPSIARSATPSPKAKAPAKPAAATPKPAAAAAPCLTAATSARPPGCVATTR